MSDDGRARHAYLRVVGTSLSPRMPDGAVLPVDADETPTTGDYAVVADGIARSPPRLVVLRAAAPAALVAPIALAGVVSEVLLVL